MVIGITGASGVQYAIRLLDVLNGHVETHLIISEQGREIIEYETNTPVDQVIKMATFYHEDSDFMAPVASGSYRWDSMVIVPCTMKTLSSIATGFADTLISRAADVTLKESRKLIIVPREMPLNLVHLENMVKVKQAGAIVMPACPGFYNRPQTIDDLVDNVVGRILDQAGIDNDIFQRWGEPAKKKSTLPASSTKIRKMH